MSDWLRDSLSSRNGFVRKGARAALAVPKWLRSWSVSRDDLLAQPPTLANSFPKSGTHLLVQLLEGLPNRVNYGAFLGSEISSFQFRERTPDNTVGFISGFVPGEIIRGHLFYDDRYAQALVERNTVNFFIYRDLRAVAVSEAHYLREMNRWHRLAPHFRKLNSIEEAITLSIGGFDPPLPGFNYPNIAQRFARYQGWLTTADCLCIRYEELQSEAREGIVRQMAEFYRDRCGDKNLDTDDCVRAMLANVAPLKSHTFRSGSKRGWQTEFTPEHHRLYEEVAAGLPTMLA